MTAKEEKKCIDCGAENEYAAKLCTSCKGKLVKIFPDLTPMLKGKKAVDPYVYLENIIEKEENDCVVVTGEPEMLNPNSYEAIAEIIRSIGQKLGITRYGAGKREWVFMECDGGIYIIAEKLISNVFLCSTCNISFYGREAYKEHSCKPPESAELVREFDWVVLIPGLLHLEMNAARSYMKLNWDIIMRDIVNVLGFTSSKAQQYIFKGKLILNDALFVCYINFCPRPVL